MTDPKYKCSQQELYTVARTGWQNCQQHQADFVAFKAKYALLFITGNLAAVETAANLPDDQARGAQAETLRIDLEKKAGVCLSNWQKLKRYISDAFPPDVQKPKLDAAGQAYYEKAGANNWDSVRGLLTAGSNFINDNLAALTLNLNMPATFKVTFNTDKASFETTHQAFLNAQETGFASTEQKIIANNDVFAKLMAMFLDGQQIYTNNDALRKLFVFDQVLNLVSGTGTAGIKGTVTNSATHQPIADAVIEIDDTKKQAVSGDDGKYQISQMAAGNYSLTVSAAGFQPFEVANHEVKVGVTGTLNIELTAVV